MHRAGGLRRFVLGRLFARVGATTSCRAGCGRETQAGDPAGRGRNDQTGLDQGFRRAEERIRLHRRAHRRARRESAEVGAPAEYFEQRRRHPGVGRNGQGLLRTARLPDRARLRCRHYRVGRARQPGRLREMRLWRAADDRDLLAVRHHADHPARCVERAAVRGAPRGTAAVQESDDRPRHVQLQRPASSLTGTP